MADVVIDATVLAAPRPSSQRGMVWTTISIGYFFGIDSDGLGKYWKTSNKGITWAGGVTFSTAAKVVDTVGIWYDKWTKSDTSTKIRIAWLDETDDICRYTDLDTSGDTLGSIATVHDPSAAVQGGSWDLVHVTVCKAEGGDVHIGTIMNDNDPIDGGHFSSDPDTISFSAVDGSGALYEVSGAFDQDSAFFFPWNSGTAADIACAYVDKASNQITLKTFSATGSAWTEQAATISHGETSSFISVAAMYRHTDDHFWIVASNTQGFSSSDLVIYRFEDSTAIAATDNVVLNTSTFSEATLMINQQNGDLYVGYMNGSTYNTVVNPVYRKSTDNSDSWGSELAYGEATAAEFTGIWAGLSVGDDGGRFQPTFAQQADSDLFTNNVNSVEIAAIAADGDQEPALIGGKLVDNSVVLKHLVH